MFFLIVLTNTVIIAAGAVVMFDQLSKTVPMNRPKRFVLHTTVFTVLFWLLSNYLLPKGSSLLDICMILITLAFTVIYSAPGNKWKGALSLIIYFTLQVLVMFVVALFAYPIAERLGYAPEDLVNIRTSFGNAFMATICLCIATPIFYLCRLLLVRLFRGDRLSLWLMCFLPIPLSQGLLMNTLNRVMHFSQGIHGVEAAYALAILFSFAADIGFFIGIWRIQQGQRLKEQVRLANEQLGVQTEYYRQLQDSILMVNQIRHDLNNHLQAAYHLLEKGETSQVRQQLNLLRDGCCSQIGPRYSSNLIVDAVLQDKAAQCRDKGIGLTISAELPFTLPIENAYLCSAFSNLLDNSIQAALESGVQAPEIGLQAVVRNNCLIISCQNSAARYERKRNGDLLRRHGLGLDILERIASQYSGSLKTSFQDGKFTATLILMFPHSGEEPAAPAQ